MELTWNVRGYFIRSEEIKFLVSNNNPSILCLQETHFKQSDNPKLRGYTFYRHDDDTGERAQGGVAIVVRDNIYSEHLPLTTPLQAVAVRVALPNPVTLCSVYLPPQAVISKTLKVHFYK
jgi:exonuclease III